MNVRRTATAPTLRAALHAAQADAERLHGDGPAPAWRGPSRRIGWPMAAAVAALLAVGAWTGLQDDEPAMPALQLASQAPRVAELQLQAPAATAPTVAAAPRAADGPAVVSPPGLHATTDEPPLQAPEADSWALHPDNALPVAGPGPLALGNTPDLPDEHDATPAEEPAADDETVGATPP